MRTPAATWTSRLKDALAMTGIVLIVIACAVPVIAGIVLLVNFA